MMVCLGNICRSTMAEALLNHKIKLANLQDSLYVESCGTSDYHVGDPPDKRTMRVLTENKITYKHLGQQLKKEHFEKFDYVLGMDSNNFREIRFLAIKNNLSEAAFIGLVRNFENGFFEDNYLEVADPYYEQGSAFNECYRILDKATDGLMTVLRAELAKKQSNPEAKI